MCQKTISMCQGKGSLSHNNRAFAAKNIDSSRTADNITFVHQNLRDAYDILFSDAVERYNARQKRNDRRIPDYFHHLFSREPSACVITGTNKQKSFYEDLVQIGTKDDTGVGTPDSEIAVACLREYMEGFSERNPNFYVFNAVMHLDEATPHLHIDYIPVGHFSNGLDTRNAMAKALEEMGYGKGANAINRWRLTEWEILHQICKAHGVEIAEPKKSRGYSYTVEEYGNHQDEIRRLNEEKEQALSERDEARAELDKAAKKKVKLDEIESIEAKESMFGKKVTLTKEDYDKLSDTAKKYVAMVKTNKKLRSEHDTAVQERDKLKEQLSAVSSELAAYKKAEKEKALFTREKLNKEAKRISREDELSRKLKKAEAFISACGLSSDYQQFRYNSTIKKARIWNEEKNFMIIRSKDKVQVIGKNKSVWVLDTNALTVTHNTVDTEPTVTAFRSEQIKYHLHYSAEYRKDRLRKLVNNGEILSYLTELDKAVENAMERQVEKWKADDKEYQQSLAVGDLCKAQGLENMFRLCAREAVYADMVYI